MTGSALALWQALNRSERASEKVIDTAVDWARSNGPPGPLFGAHEEMLVDAVNELLAAREAVTALRRAGSEDGAT